MSRSGWSSQLGLNPPALTNNLKAMSDQEPQASFRANRPDVIDETFDGEAVLVNLDSGCYFALTPAGTVVWELISQGRSLGALLASLDGDADAISGFVAMLVDEGLLVAADADLGPTAEPVAVDGAPSFEKFTDMQELLMLDPIHDIDLDADGWPVAPPA